MDLNRLSPIVEEVVKQVLAEKRYPFGFANNRGLSNKIASGKLYNSIKAIQTDESTITVFGPGNKPLNQTYGDWGGRGDVNIGRKPGLKGVPISALEDWIRARGIKGRDKKGRFITNKSLAFAIQTNIKKFGIKSSNFVEYSLDVLEKNKQLVEAIEQISLEELINIIEGI